MARDKPPESFNHSPFKTLKGLSVSGGAQPSPVVPPVPSPPPVEPDDERELFAREMAWLNVHPVAGKTAGPAGGTAPGLAPSSANDGAAEFLAAVGKLGKTFQTDLHSSEEPPRARPRRMKQLERGELKPAGELDLHGLTRDEALPRTRSFLGHAARQGWPVVLIVTGKGLHSAEGPVLRQAVERLLDDCRDLVLEWGAAPRRFGGTGALAVFVKIAQ